MLKPQWYVDTDDMARRACEVVKSGELKIIPEDHQKTWFRSKFDIFLVFVLFFI